MIAGAAPTVGTAGGGIAGLPFIGGKESDLPCCAPTATGGVVMPDAVGGWNGFLVALAYEGAVAGTGAGPKGDAVPLIEADGECAWLTVCVTLVGAWGGRTGC